MAFWGCVPEVAFFYLFVSFSALGRVPRVVRQLLFVSEYTSAGVFGARGNGRILNPANPLGGLGELRGAIMAFTPVVPVSPVRYGNAMLQRRLAVEKYRKGGIRVIGLPPPPRRRLKVR